MRLILKMSLLTLAFVGLAAVAIPSLDNGLETYYENMKTCTPATYSYDALNMNIKNTKQIVGKQDDKCVIHEEINPEMVLVCKLPMNVAAKYAKENIRLIKAREENKNAEIINEFVEKVENDRSYCSVQLK